MTCPPGANIVDQQAVERRAYARGAGRRPILDMLMVCADISDVSLT